MRDVSDPGGSSRFSLSLPLVRGAIPTAAAKPMLDDPGGRILIVEDNAVLLLGLEATLQEWGYETLAAIAVKPRSISRRRRAGAST